MDDPILDTRIEQGFACFYGFIAMMVFLGTIVFIGYLIYMYTVII